ncbi:hypothetical protein GCM10028856_26640 [Halopiger thermotolerans]
MTPAHPPGPDFDAALTLLEGIESLYPVEIDEGELRRRSEEMHRYYEELADRMTALRQRDQPVRGRDFPEDRMYM